jgi:hypothetical protein
VTDELLDTAIAVLDEVLRLHADATTDELADAFSKMIDLVSDLRADLAVARNDFAEDQHRAACGLEG